MTSKLVLITGAKKKTCLPVSSLRLARSIPTPATLSPTSMTQAARASERPATPTDPPGVPPPASPKHNQIRGVGSTSEGRERTPIGVVSQLPILTSINTGIHAMVGFGSPPPLHAFLSGGVVADLAY